MEEMIIYVVPCKETDTKIMYLKLLHLNNTQNQANQFAWSQNRDAFGEERGTSDWKTPK